MVRILIEPEYNLLMQQINLFKTEGVDLQFTREAIEKIAEISFYLNQNT
jgi:ATP-dependent HslUV protease ATP-binding subunit HslU